MHKLFWIGSPFFSGALASCGWDVRVHNFEHLAVYGWDDIVRTAGFEPHVVVVADKSRPPFVLGMEDFPCHTVFYGVDTHIHSWFPWYAQGFDACLVSLKDHLSTFRGMRLPDERLCWFPAFAPDHAQPRDMTKRWDCVFVGNVSAERTPLRQIFLKALHKKLEASGVSFAVMQGDYTQIYPQSRVVFNYCELGDLNFRVFEALGCGSCLVTPYIENGLTDLFTPGVDLLTYPKDDVDGAFSAILHALKVPSLRHCVEKNGLEAVDRAHRAKHRALVFTDFVRHLPADLPAVRKAQADLVRRSWLRMLYLLEANALTEPLLRQAYVDAAMGRFSHP